MNTVSTIETIAPGITMEWLHDKQIVVFTLKTAHRDSIDAWMNAVKKLSETLPPNKPSLILHDTSSKEASFTPYMRARMKEFEKMPMKASSLAVAIILPQSFISQIIKFWVGEYKPAQGVTVKLFTVYDAGLKWLEGKLTP